MEKQGPVSESPSVTPVLRIDPSAIGNTKADQDEAIRLLEEADAKVHIEHVSCSEYDSYTVPLLQTNTAIFEGLGFIKLYISDFHPREQTNVQTRKYPRAIEMEDVDCVRATNNSIHRPKRKKP